MKCGQCGRRNGLQAEFCSGCGAKLEPQPTPPRPAEAEAGAESWRWNIIWMLVVLALVAGLCVYAFQPEGHFRGRAPQAADK